MANLFNQSMNKKDILKRVGNISKSKTLLCPVLCYYLDILLYYKMLFIIK